MNGERPYFHIEYLIDTVFKLTPEEKAENEKYWLKDSNSIGSDTNEPSGGEPSGGEFGENETSTIPLETPKETEVQGQTQEQTPNENTESGENTEFEF
jgi:hypothetical protein